MAVVGVGIDLVSIPDFAAQVVVPLERLLLGELFVDLVEKASTAATLIQRNAGRVAKAIGASLPMRTHRAGVTPFLRTTGAAFDLVFIDPPYDVTEAELTEALVALFPRLSTDAVVIVERDRRSPAPSWEAAGLEAMRDRSYGDTAMWWGQPRPESQSA